jgi:hypothetical protein
MSSISTTWHLIPVVIGAGIMTASCGPIIIFQGETIEYMYKGTMQQNVSGTPFMLIASGQRCYVEFSSGSGFQRKTHTFRLSDQVDPQFSSDPPNRIMLDIFDQFGVRPGEYFDYVLDLMQESAVVEELRFRFENTGTQPIQQHRFVIKNAPDTTKPNEEGGFQNPTRPVGGTYVMSTTGLGRPLLATLYFPITNNATVYDYCGPVS